MENLKDRDSYIEELHKEIELLREELRLVRATNEELRKAIEAISEKTS